MKRVARFVTRLQGKGDGLFIGALMGEGAFKPNTVYEIQEILGEYVIKEVGMACGAGPDNCVTNTMSSGEAMFPWFNDVGYIIAMNGEHMFLTLAEYKAMLKQGEIERPLIKQ